MWLWSGLWINQKFGEMTKAFKVFKNPKRVYRKYTADSTDNKQIYTELDLPQGLIKGKAWHVWSYLFCDTLPVIIRTDVMYMANDKWKITVNYICWYCSLSNTILRTHVQITQQQYIFFLFFSNKVFHAAITRCFLTSLKIAKMLGKILEAGVCHIVPPFTYGSSCLHPNLTFGVVKVTATPVQCTVQKVLVLRNHSLRNYLTIILWFKVNQFFSQVWETYVVIR